MVELAETELAEAGPSPVHPPAADALQASLEGLRNVAAGGSSLEDLGAALGGLEDAVVRCPECAPRLQQLFPCFRDPLQRMLVVLALRKSTGESTDSWLITQTDDDQIVRCAAVIALTHAELPMESVGVVDLSGRRPEQRPLRTHEFLVLCALAPTRTRDFAQRHVEYTKLLDNTILEPSPAGSGPCSSESWPTFADLLQWRMCVEYLASKTPDAAWKQVSTAIFDNRAPGARDLALTLVESAQRCGVFLDEFRRLADSVDDTDRYLGLRGLVAADNPVSVHAIVALVCAWSDPRMRLDAIAALGRCSERQLASAEVSIVTAFGREAHAGVRHSFVSLIERLRTQRSVEVRVGAALNDSDSAVRDAAVRSLISSPGASDPSVRTFLAALADRDPSGPLSRIALHALAARRQ